MWTSGSLCILEVIFYQWICYHIRSFTIELYSWHWPIKMFFLSVTSNVKLTLFHFYVTNWLDLRLIIYCSPIKNYRHVIVIIKVYLESIQQVFYILMCKKGVETICLFIICVKATTFILNNPCRDVLLYNRRKSFMYFQITLSLCLLLRIILFSLMISLC